MMNYSTETLVEKFFLEPSGYKYQYPPLEKVKSIIVENFPMLGKLVALRFMEWVQKNPGGVISLPTGKTPEYFIKWVQHYLRNWDKNKVRKELEEAGIDTKIFPDMRSLVFVQIDEFYPLLPRQQNSFYYYIHKFYIEGFGLDKKKALLIDASRLGIPDKYNLKEVFPDEKVDLSLRTRHPKSYSEQMQWNAITAVDQFCVEYEEKIRSLGGIGFFLGGIGPDGHIGFNVRGSDFFSTTRLTPINYETAAVSSMDLGGIEVSRHRLVITIGLSTITFYKNVVAIVMAAGESKAEIVAKSIQNPENILYPATILQKIPHSRFYLTRGAASGLLERKLIKLKNKKEITETDIQTCLIDHALEHKTTIEKVHGDDLKKDRFMTEILSRTKKSPAEIKRSVQDGLIRNIRAGIQEIKDSTILHTSPHHDDEMLGYLPLIIHLIREPSNKSFFSYMTSGFTSVTNFYMLSLLQNLNAFLLTPRFRFLFHDGYFTAGYPHARNDDVYYFLDGLSLNDLHVQNEALARRLLRILVEVFEENHLESVRERLHELINYFKTQYPGKKDLPYIQKIKGMVREFESELVWGYFGFETSSVIHARLGFYTGDIFTRQPDVSSDVIPVLNILRRIKPDIVTVALDPEGSGPDTHYKVLQTIAEALKLYQSETHLSHLKVWGYRNVWYRFHPAEANVYVPVSLNSLSVLNHAFLNCFGSQKDASFPSYEYDGPFSQLAQKIMVEQYYKIKECLGESYFFNNPHPRLRATKGFVFLKEMALEEFYQHSTELKKIMGDF